MIFYRYELAFEGIDEENSIVITKLNKYNLVKETPKGYWIRIANSNASPSKWISKTANKRFAHTSKEKAIDGFIQRQKDRIKILKKQIGHSMTALRIAETSKSEQLI